MIPTFQNKAELFEYLRLNKDLLIRQKRMEFKKADAVMFLPVEEGEEIAVKSVGEAGTDPTELMVKAVINTTNIMDSHDDVHISGLWKKSLSENKNILHLQEHEMKFDKLISDEVNAYTKMIPWKSLGFDFEGNTQALVFESTVKAADNGYMFDQYRKGRVKNHSVGMQYVKIQMAVNSKDKYFAEEKAAWDKYLPEIVNRQVAEDKGYFFAVTEAKVIEGSAVLIGSNRATPTISVSEAAAEKGTPHEHTEPPVGTQIDWNTILTSLKQTK